MTMPTIWITGEACPDCAAALTLADDGGGSLRAECCSCGYADTWTSENPDDRDPDHLGRGDQ
jgi:Zn ribbon nucleic-acid-binding protein